ncbi:MAG: prolyl oligopeptidase family serine peptidase [Synechococcales cyanobacterium CRU_2_2]|nr:prolyl oligopeptidase family serine peptidase [Synechococcales cyanobacterium CRU_2_2]
MRYLYLHGLASGPDSAKAKYLRDRFRSLGLSLEQPDFNQPDFASLTLTRQIHQVEALLATPPEAALDQPPEPVTLIGSSFGGLTAAWVAQRQPQVQQLILLAPAFNFLPAWLAAVGRTQAQAWRETGQIPTYHYGYRRMEALNYTIVEDMQQYDDLRLTRSLPTLILHGLQDGVIPIEASRSYAMARPWAALIELDSDHSLGNVVSRIWQEIQRVCPLEKAGAGITDDNIAQTT